MCVQQLAVQACAVCVCMSQACVCMLCVFVGWDHHPLQGAAGSVAKKASPEASQIRGARPMLPAGAGAAAGAPGPQLPGAVAGPTPVRLSNQSINHLYPLLFGFEWSGCGGELQRRLCA